MQNTSMNRIAMCALLAFGLSAHAQDTTKQPAVKKGADQKVDISDLENKYWAPKDTDFSVVQNRTYSKTGHYFVTPNVGFLVNDSYSKGPVFGVTANYFFSERHGMQLSFQKAALSDNDETSAFKSLSTGVIPNHNKLNEFYGIGYSFVPFYAKMSFMGTKVMYFDMAITPILGATNYTQTLEAGDKNKLGFTYGLDVTQYFFINRYFAVRIDLNNHWTSEEKLSWGNDTINNHTPGQSLGNYTNLDTTLAVGATFYF